MAFDVDEGRLFVAAVAADSVEVVDVVAGRWQRRLEGSHGPQGVVYVHRENRLFVANGQDGRVDAFTDHTRHPVKSTAFLGDADNLRFEPMERLLYVGYEQALGVIDPVTLAVVRTVAVGGHPEAFELEGAGRRIFVNVPSERYVAVIDRDAGTMNAVWRLAGAAENFAMALDESRGRLFVATRRPAMLLVYDTGKGVEVTRMPTCRDADDMYFDARRRQIYVVCGEGVVESIRQVDPDNYRPAGRTPTSPGARTGLFVPGLSTLFVAAPASVRSAAQILVYSIQ
jgi:YVTN family beta-propeller protein